MVIILYVVNNLMGPTNHISKASLFVNATAIIYNVCSALKFLFNFVFIEGLSINSRLPRLSVFWVTFGIDLHPPPNVNGRYDQKNIPQ